MKRNLKIAAQRAAAGALLLASAALVLADALLGRRK